MLIRPKLIPLFSLLLLALSLSSFPHACTARLVGKNCGYAFCGNLSISYPFRLKTQSRSCGYNRFELVCENNRAIFPMKHGNFYVQHISYVDQTIHLVDVSLDSDNCSIPHGSSPWYNPSAESLSHEGGFYIYISEPESSEIYVVNCTMKMINSANYVNASRCSSNRSSSPTPSPSNYFYFLDGGTPASDFDPSCTVEAQVPIMLHNITGLSTFDIYEKLLTGFQLKWSLGWDSGLHWNSVVNVLRSSALVLVSGLVIYIQSILAFMLRGTSMQGFWASPGKESGEYLCCNNSRDFINKDTFGNILLDCPNCPQIKKKTFVNG